MVVGGTVLLGLAAGVVGSFTLLRKRALLGDALSHATLPGIAIAFLLGTAVLGLDAKSLPLLLAGAVASGVLGLAVVLVFRRYTRLKEDAVLGCVLSVFFGAGICLLTLVQQMGSGSAAGLESFIYGKTASMVPQDVTLIGIAAVAVIVACGLLFKELRLLCFDPAYAQSQGWPVLALDVALMGMVTAVTVVGLQAVGLILVIAMLIIPAAAARFWSDRALPMTVLAGGIGALCGGLGSVVSGLAEDLPSGALIVLVATTVFALSMAFGRARGVVPRWLRSRRVARRIGRQHLLRAAYEVLEADPRRGSLREAVTLEELLPRRSWTPRRLRRLAHSAEATGRATFHGDAVRLSHRGIEDARRVVRNHRLWETYLIHFADIAPTHVDREADAIEHVLGPEMIEELERLVAGRETVRVPEDPHGEAERRREKERKRASQTPST